jgi:hypothetical protein
MHKPFIAILTAAVLACAAFTTGAAGANHGPHRYSPKHGHCKRGYRRVKPRHKVLCIKKAAKRRAAPSSFKLHAHLDPTFTRDPLKPFKVTYDFSASATQEAARATASPEAPAPLPAGVLSLYSDGILECAVNVGGAEDSGACPVSYQALGLHRVTTVYTSGSLSSTVTETEQIDPIATATALGVSYAPLPYSAWEFWKVRVSGTGPPGSGEEGWRIGTLTIALSSQPAGAVQPTLTCSSGATGCLDLGQPTNGTLQLGVYVMNNQGPGEPINNFIHFGMPQEGEGFTRWQSVPNVEAGQYFLRGVSQCFFNCGYTATEATSLVQFSPGSFPPEPQYGELPQG